MKRINYYPFLYKQIYGKTLQLCKTRVNFVDLEAIVIKRFMIFSANKIIYLVPDNDYNSLSKNLCLISNPLLANILDGRINNNP